MVKSRLVYISGSNIPSNQANSIHVIRMCDALSEFYEVELLAFKGSSFSSLDHISLMYGITNNFKIQFYPKNKSFIVSIFKKVSLIYLLVNKMGKSVFIGRNLPGCFYSAIFGGLTCYESHGLIWKGNFIDKLFFYFLIKLNSFHKLLLISEAQRALYLERYPYLASKIEVLHDGAEIPKIKTTSKGVLRVDKSKFNVGYSGSLYSGRGLNIIYELAKLNRNIDFHIIGGDRSEISENFLDLDNLIFHGRLMPSLISNELSNFDLLIAPYQREVKVAGNVSNTADFMSPLKVFEYMAVKKPILISDLPVIREVLSDDDAMFAIPDSIESWDVQLKKIANDTDLRDTLSENAHRKFCENYTWNIRAIKIHKYFEIN